MTFQSPAMVLAAVVVAAALVAGYVALDRRRTGVLASSGLTGAALSGARRHTPYVLFVAAVVLLVLALARPEGTVSTPRVSGTLVLAFDVSNSMGADDVSPSRLEAARKAAKDLITAQPGAVDVGVVAFAEGALTVQEPSADHTEALAAVGQLAVSGGTSLGQAILAALGAISGEVVELPEEGEQPPDLGYWSSATIVVLSDGEETTPPDAASAAALAATAGVHIDTIGVGTLAGTTVEVDGYRMATSLNEETLTEVAQISGGSYRPLADLSDLDDLADSLNLRLTLQEEDIELTAALAGLGLLLLVAGSSILVLRTGRLV